MGKVYKTANINDTRHLLSQTPKDYVKDNYYLEQMQQKIDADWPYRPNRVTVEQECERGVEDYEPLEVVIQSVKSDSGEIISDDWRRIVFRDIHYRCPIGTKFRIAPGYDYSVADEKKNIFLVVNKTDDVSVTSSVVVKRCNGTLGSTYLNNKGVTCYHYEPAVQAGISGTSFNYNQIVTSPDSDITVVVQHNKFTANYFINQRFVIGYDRVYRITNIDKFYSNSTFDAENVGNITLYLSLDEKNPADNFNTHIAVNETAEVVVVNPTIDTYKLELITPTTVPTELTYDPMNFEVELRNGDQKVDTGIDVSFEIDSVADVSEYVFVERLTGNSFAIHKLQFNTSPIKITFYVKPDDNPTGQKLELSFVLSLDGLL